MCVCLWMWLWGFFLYSSCVPPTTCFYLLWTFTLFATCGTDYFVITQDLIKKKLFRHRMCSWKFVTGVKHYLSHSVPSLLDCIQHWWFVFGAIDFDAAQTSRWCCWITPFIQFTGVCLCVGLKSFDEDRKRSLTSIWEVIPSDHLYGWVVMYSKS